MMKIRKFVIPCSLVFLVQVQVSCRAEEVLSRLQAEEEVNALLGTANKCLWRPEFGAFQIEGTPGVPYGG